MKRIILCVCILLLAGNAYARTDRVLKNKLKNTEAKLQVVQKNYLLLSRQVIVLIKRLQRVQKLDDLDQVLKAINIYRIKEDTPLKP